jgi:hypothetical protein
MTDIETEKKLIAKRLEVLGRAILEFEVKCRHTMGFTRTISYRDIDFYVSSHLVVADLAPLAFLHLVERIDERTAEDAVARLYERISPLLICQHQWTVSEKISDESLRQLAEDARERGSLVHICRLCTAYVLRSDDIPLPAVGKMTI